ncbi:lysine transporter LysE [Desulfosarcina alkanivorans]|uniref:Lysine transporter LysE n=1 Tax=Desulfosarcina alkanivorans TaxID=571177 RepID=A0A5K7Z1I7_9BACT|nr:LysE family translocator [Desulfosarcina alkanivorans]BBO70647.1 lysine transporter LysE [Desulfosarcina alkanivorans]
MFGIHDFPLFLISCILLNITPGQDTLYIIGRSVAQGRQAGVMSVLGIMTGVLVHTLLAALGLSVILATSSLAFAVIKYAGAAYLVWIGIGFIITRHDGASLPDAPASTPDPRKIFRQGVLTNVLNPKVALFFLSFLPQFVSAQTDLVFLPFMVLGLVFFTTGSLWCLFLVYGAAWLSARFRGRSSAGGALKKITGALFIGLGIRLALSQAR